jgi:hypothetical protein
VCAVRPAFLVDTAVLDSDLNEFVNELRLVRSPLMSQTDCQEHKSLVAIELDGHVVLAHRELLRDLLARFVEGKYRPVLIDFLSQGIASKSASEHLRHVASALLEVIEKASVSPAVEFPGGSHSLPTLAGLLLSYPAIYYSERNNDRLVDANVAVFGLHTGGVDRRNLMQFSCPPDLAEIVLETLKLTVQEWETRISNMPAGLKEKWINYTRAESCTLEIQMETRRVPILTL